MEKRNIIVRNMAKCKQCGDVIESKFRHDYVTCSCGSIAVDGGKSYLRRAFKDEDSIEEMSEMKEISEEEYQAILQLRKDAARKYNEELLLEIFKAGEKDGLFKKS